MFKVDVEWSAINLAACIMDLYIRELRIPSMMVGPSGSWLQPRTWSCNIGVISLKS